MKIAVIILVGEKFEKLFLESYNRLNAGMDHDLIVVHRNKMGLNENIQINNDNILFENKIINGEDVPKRAFGAYRHFFYKYRENYDFFVFISDDVVLRRQNWLKDIIDVMFSDTYIGFGGSQIFNGNKKYPCCECHPYKTHVRAPFWFAKKEALSKIKWEFGDDHEGEMITGDLLSNSGYVGVQVGNKLNLGYDSFEKDHITQLLELKYFKDKNLVKEYNEREFNFFEELYENSTKEEIYNNFVFSPYHYINFQNVFIDIEPFNNIIYRTSLKTALEKLNVVDKKNGIFVYEQN